MEGIASIARASERPSPAARVIAEGSPVWWPRLRPLRSISQQASSSGATIAAAIKIPMAGACAQCRRQSTSRPRTHTISSAGQPTAGSWKTGYRQIAPRIGSAIDHDRGSRRSGLAQPPAPVTERARLALHKQRPDSPRVASRAVAYQVVRRQRRGFAAAGSWSERGIRSKWFVRSERGIRSGPRRSSLTDKIKLTWISLTTKRDRPVTER